jgi:hypothetical protein
LVLLAKPSAVQLVIGHDPQEYEANTNCQKASDKEDNLPRFDIGARLSATDRDAVRNAATEDLGKPIEAEPDTCARTLLFLCVPLGCEECEAGSDLCLI